VTTPPALHVLFIHFSLSHWKALTLVEAPDRADADGWRCVSCYKSIPRVAVRVVPLYEAEMVAEVEMRTRDVSTVKVALLAPAGMSTLKGTLAAPLLLERKI
jgi:hypothetical protein